MARPAEFDRKEVLDKAMHVFWQSGYNATSISDIVNATHLQPGSLYGAFHSKRELFLEIIDIYANRSLTRINECLASCDTAVAGIEKLFYKIGDEIKGDQDCKGCLMINTLLELSNEDQEINQKITSYLTLIEIALKDALIRARQNNEISQQTDCKSLAKTLIASIWGLRVMSSTRPNPDVYKGMITCFLRTIPKK